MHATTNDGINIKEFLEKDCGFTQIQWFKDEDACNANIQDAFDNNAKGKQKALYFVYYSGHGALVDGMTVGYTNSEEVIELERNVRRLALYCNSYVIALFDCCRHIHLQTRGGQADDPLSKLEGQLYMIHAVAPGKSAVSRRSADAIAAVHILHMIS